MTNQIADRIKKYTVVARFSGYVVSKMAEEGQWLKQGDPVAEVLHLDQVEVEVHVTEQNINHIRVGSKTFVEIPAAGKEPFEGTVSAIVPQADVRTRTFPVRILISNRFIGQEAVIKSGMYARAKLSSGGSQKSKLVPKDALVLGGAQPKVFVVENGKVRPVSVELGGGYKDRIQVIGSLQAGQQVVVEGNERLRPGQEVEVIRTMEVSTDNRSTTGGGNQ
jgi:RND family efflux transporter MFP subunit